MGIDSILERLNGVKKSGPGYIALCPAHEDRHRSLSVTEQDGRILIHCFTGCSLDSILAALGLEQSDLFVDSYHKQVSAAPIAERQWDIINYNGMVPGIAKDAIIATHHRIDYIDKPKNIFWRRNGQLGLGGFKTARLPFYGLQSLNGQNEYCILTEGEPACDALLQAGFSALATVCGASSTPNDSVLEILRNFVRVYLWPDADQPGIDHMQRIAGRLVDMGCNPYIITWVDAPEKGDAADYLERGHDVQVLLDTATRWPPPQTAVDAQEDPYKYSLTDTGNAERFVRDHGENLHYCPERDRWLLWKGTHWQWGDRARTQAMELAKDTVRNMYHEAGEIVEDAARADMVKHARQSESEQRRKAMVNLAQSEPGIPLPFGMLDQQQWLLNCQNGAVDLRTGELIPSSRDHLATMCIPIEYDEMADCVNWLNFIDQITCGDEQLARYLQKAVGYSLTGDTREQCLFFLYGGGTNGKSTFINTLLRIFGPYGHETSTDVFMLKDRGNSGPKEGLANLQGKRFVAATELEEGQRLATATVKMVTGGEKITADRKHEHEISFWPTHKLWFSGNHKPRITDTTDSIWRRVKLIPFNLQLSKAEIDGTLKEKFYSQEAPGILRWAVWGTMFWQSEGLSTPDTVRSATGQYRHDEDPVGEFLETNCIFSSIASVTVKLLYNQYQTWCEANGEKALGLRRFNARVTEKGFEKAPGTGNQTTWYGLSFLHNKET